MELKAVKRKKGKYYFKGSDGKLYGEGYDDVWYFEEGYAKIEKDGERFYVKKEEFEKTGSSHLYKYRNFSEGFNVVYEHGKYYFIDVNGKLYGEGYNYALWDFNEGYARVEKDRKEFSVKMEEFKKTGSPRLYKYSDFSKGFNIVYENSKYYFIDENGKPYGEGYDDVENFHEGFAEVKKDGKYYFIDKDFKLYGEGYDRVSNFGKGVVSVVNAGRRYFTKLIPGKALKVYGNGFRYYLDSWKGKKYRSYYHDNNIIDGVKGYFSWKEMESKDYLNLAKEDPTYCLCIPEVEFSDKFVKKLGNIASKYYEKKIKNSDSKNYMKLSKR